MLVILVPGYGTSTLARALADRRHGVVLDNGPIRAARFGAEVEF